MRNILLMHKESGILFEALETILFTELCDSRGRRCLLAELGPRSDFEEIGEI